MGGGLIATDDVLMYDAPESGYQNSWSLMYERDDKDWALQPERKFYFRAKNGRVYGRLNVKFFPFFNVKGDSAVRVSYWVNADGTRDLYSERVP